MNIEERILSFRYMLIHKQPFYGDIATHIEIIPDKWITTACTDGKSIYYNPKFLQSLPDNEMHFVLMHEIFHILLLHRSRIKDRDTKTWNKAADLVVNSLLTKVGIDLKRPDGALCSGIAIGRNTEELYEELILGAKKNRGSSWQQPKYGLKKNGAPSLLPEYSEPLPSRYLLCNDIKARTLSPEEAEKLEGEVRALIDNAAKTAKEVGKGFSNIPRDLLKLTESPKLNWKTILKDLLEEVSDEDCSYATPERKYLHMDLILPGHGPTQDGIEQLWVFVDSSGSISQEELNSFMTQLYRIVKQFNCTLNLAFWSTEVGEPYLDIIGEKKLLTCKPNADGGTDINCVYNWLRKNKIKPNIMLIMTDGYFGSLEDRNKKPRLRPNTILVLSNNCEITDEMKTIGKVAKL